MLKAKAKPIVWTKAVLLLCAVFGNFYGLTNVLVFTLYALLNGLLFTKLNQAD